MRTRPYIPLRERQKRRERRRRLLRRTSLTALLVVALVPLLAGRINNSTNLIAARLADLEASSFLLRQQNEGATDGDRLALSAVDASDGQDIAEAADVADEPQALMALRVVSEVRTEPELSRVSAVVQPITENFGSTSNAQIELAVAKDARPAVEAVSLASNDVEADDIEIDRQVGGGLRTVSLAATALNAHSGEEASDPLDVSPNPYCAAEDCVTQGAPFSATGLPKLLAQELGKFRSFQRSDDQRFYETNVNGERIRFTLDPELQEYAEGLMEQYRIPWGAIVAVEPATGKILALASYSSHDRSNPRLALQGGFPAASLFKVVTAAAGVERSGLSAASQIQFRGGNYTLTRYNYYPDPKTDRRAMSLAAALGKSCNPAFARVALNHLSADILQYYAENFGFNQPIPFELPLALSEFTLPETDYELARTAAGFMNAQITPVHAALLAAAVGNGGEIMRPYIVEWVRDGAGTLKYRASKLPFRRAVLPSTAIELLRMMDNTTVEGTARRHFQRAGSRLLREMQVAGKTGTLSGPNPQGVYHWFVGVAPSDLDPVGVVTADLSGAGHLGVESAEIAVAALVIDPGGARINGTGLARRFLEFYFRNSGPQIEARAHDRENG